MREVKRLHRRGVRHAAMATLQEHIARSSKPSPRRCWSARRWTSEDIELLAAGEPLPEARLVRQAREFADSLRREKGALAAPRTGAGADAGADAGDAGDAGDASTEGGSVAVADPEPEPGR
jgi:hypothetical protein